MGTPKPKNLKYTRQSPRERSRDTSMILPLIDAFSGCDSTSAFSGMSKERLIEVATSQGELPDGLESLGNSITYLSKETMDAFVALASLMYVGKVNSSLDNVRYKLFAKNSKTSEKLPPTMDAFHHHLRRTNFQAYIWKYCIVQH